MAHFRFFLSFFLSFFFARKRDSAFIKKLAFRTGRGGGYQSEPDNTRYDYDSDAGRYATLDRRRQRIHNDSESNGGSPARITCVENQS